MKKHQSIVADIASTVMIILLLLQGVCSKAENKNGACGQAPAFAIKKGSTAPLFTSAERGRVGVIMLDSHKNDYVFQDPSWKEAGSVGPIVVTEKGEVFFAPTPSINTLENPPGGQNSIYRIDPATGVATKWLTLPVPHALAPSQNNPFGIVGLTYDCYRQVLLCSSVSGSTQQEERGTIVVIDPRAAVIVDTVESIDALGLTTFYSKDKPWIIFGSARAPALFRLSWSFPHTIGVRRELIYQLAEGGNVRARKIISTSSGLEVMLTEFKYMLLGQSELRTPRLHVSYNELTDLYTLASQVEEEFNPAMIPEIYPQSVIAP